MKPPMERRIQFLVVALGFFTNVFSQKATLNGYITDKKTGERLFGASIYVLDKNLGTTSNGFGFYSITLPQDSVEVSFSFTGYATITQKIPLFEDKTLDIELEYAQALGEVVVKSVKKEAIQNRTQMSTIDLPVSMIKSLPAL